MEKVIHRATGRGYEDNRWIRSYHTFSYSDFYDPRRINFGALRVLSDNVIEAGEGFGTHTHDNMEIITVMLEGALEQGDRRGNTLTVHTGEVQVLSTGTSILHNEYNKSQTDPAKFLRIWIYPKQTDIEPCYSSAKIPKLVPNELTTIVAPYDDLQNGDEPLPDGQKEGRATTMEERYARISQRTWLYLAELTKSGSVKVTMHEGDLGAYIFVMGGEISVGDTILGQGDSMGIWHADSFTIESATPSKVLVIEIPNKN